VPEPDDGPGDGARIVLGKRRDEGPVDLDDVERQASQRRERGVAGPEVVDGQVDAVLAQLGEYRDCAVVLLHQDALGHLEAQVAGVQSGRAEGGADELGEVGLAQLPA